MLSFQIPGETLSVLSHGVAVVGQFKGFPRGLLMVTGKVEGGGNISRVFSDGGS